ncbi:MAG TPA: AAA family ATPase [Kofleriaceae bacterium]|nr:AAA family ATPase [Kofleriaceae bacterium]
MKVHRVHIKNFKSIVDMRLELAPVNVFIGENGSGKSNILEALAFASAAAADKLDNEFLVSRGIRVTDPHFMRSAFARSSEDPIFIDVEDEHGFRVFFNITTLEDTAYPRWISSPAVGFVSRDSGSTPLDDSFVTEFMDAVRSRIRPKLGEIKSAVDGLQDSESAKKETEVLSSVFSLVKSRMAQSVAPFPLRDFVIYSPEVSALRTFEKEGQILPLGTRGEGLLKLLRVLAKEDQEGWHALQHNLGLLDWLLGIEIDHDSTLSEQSIRIRDRFLADGQPAFDQRSANEGFLYLLFFFALILSKATPRFFAIENVDTSLNPKACSELMHRLATLAIERERQILFTTHNPSLLDGLNLHDDKQRLFVVFRNRDGHTCVRRIMPPEPVGDELPVKLSEAFTRGLLGGIPQNF